VREAVSGYRRPTLDSELRGAQMALAAAGIDASVKRPDVNLDPAVEAVLAWAVREAATNVIRHSGAGTCSVTVTAGLTEAGVLVVDDGEGAAVAGTGNGGGHGLEGLRAG
jgi:two-component system sensor histidine kinase DesK